jgi:hypothetical protein
VDVHGRGGPGMARVGVFHGCERLHTLCVVPSTVGVGVNSGVTGQLV